ncbi:DNA-3-methyladenine glycosidase Mag2 [Schizosaccharomyces japonicus yFS275]|uniref:DNA-3-methyladenine glycosidase Mag2 n=1 Tax=Schizosaccharomyces japonicus (strain yFS275 / FY16936) TaxID=402676 RepID=B6K1P6_SCHJY|nr:DNA-3-methyladenine glycosidase Mag2 [Schizosaccharomyces japonicus yFS275]EEB07077.1 DNA-3-methyladenine glycosidase Mag2 [Schizosaccharomyces japonicus yFS275]
MHNNVDQFHPLTQEDLIKGEKQIASLDEQHQELVRCVGQCTLKPQTAREPYEGLIHALTYQRLSDSAGDAILGRLCQHFHKKSFPSVQELLSLDTEDLRSFGFSHRKGETILELANMAADGSLPSREEISHMPLDKMIGIFTKVKGIGAWTVEKYAIFTLGRPNVMPTMDREIRENVQLLYHLDHTPTDVEMEERSRAYVPYKTVASWYLWRVPELIVERNQKM